MRGRETERVKLEGGVGFPLAPHHERCCSTLQCRIGREKR